MSERRRSTAAPTSRTEATIAKAGLTGPTIAEARPTESEGAAVEAATKACWSEAAAEATEMVESAAQQKPERPRLSARPC